jgi:hypothetical protein
MTNLHGSGCRSRAIVDRFADLMDLRGDRSRLDAYFGGGRGGKQQQQQLPPVAYSAAAAVGVSAAAQGVKLEEDETAVTAAAAAAASCAEAGSGQPDPWHHECSSPCPASEAATPHARADSCDNASEFDGNASEWDAMSEGSPPPEGVADEEQNDDRASAAAAWPRDAGLPEDELQMHVGGAAAATQALRAADSCAAAVSATPPVMEPDASHGSEPAGQQAPSADTALRDGSRPEGVHTASVPAVAAEARAADSEHMLDGVSVRQQELIMAMIAARNARRGMIGSGSPAAGGGTASALSSRGGSFSTGTCIAVTQSAPLPAAAQAGCGSAAAEDGVSPLGRQKRQRTLAGFLLTPVHSCKY